MIIADTSAWIGYLRGTASSTSRALRALIVDEGPLRVVEVVLMELLAGARSDTEAGSLLRLCNRFEMVHTEGVSDHLAAARLYRECRQAGLTIRSLNDCLIASVAMRVGAAVLHADRDFDAIARHSPLRIARVEETG